MSPASTFLGSFDLITLEDIRSAAERVGRVLEKTPLVPLEVPGLPYSLYIKCESASPVGSFKLRGAYNMISQLTPEELKRGVITYSSGNHAQGVAFAARSLGARAIVVMPNTAPAVKQKATADFGADIVLVTPESNTRRAKAEEMAREFGYTLVPPYDHAKIIAGQATCGVEIVQQLPDADLVIAPVSGGGLLGGIAAAVKMTGRSGIQVWGAEPVVAADAKESLETRTLVEWSASLTGRTVADGLRAQALGAENFKYILQYVDGIAAVTEPEILTAMRTLLAAQIKPEPSGAVAPAAGLFHSAELPPASKVVVVLSGGNVDPEFLAQLDQQK